MILKLKFKETFFCLINMNIAGYKKIQIRVKEAIKMKLLLITAA